MKGPETIESLNGELRRKGHRPLTTGNFSDTLRAGHHAIEMGRLKVSGTAPDEITWEGLFGVIERPPPNSKKTSTEAQYGYADGGDTSEVKEPRTPYFAANPALYPRGRKSNPRGSEPKKDRSAIRTPGTSMAVLPLRSSHVGQVMSAGSGTAQR